MFKHWFIVVFLIFLGFNCSFGVLAKPNRSLSRFCIKLEGSDSSSKLINNKIQHVKNNMNPNIYLLSGQGSDERIFSGFKWDSCWNVNYIEYPVPIKNETMAEYAKRLSKNIDTTKPFYLVGVSMGGMLSIEIGHILNPEKIILISSAKTTLELPSRYKKSQKLGVQKLIPPKLYKFGALLLQPIVEPDRRHQKKIFKAMLNDKDSIFLKRSAIMISTWKRDTCTIKNIVHIHGTKDHTVPIRNVKPTYIINGGSHMMALTQTAKIESIIKKELPCY